MRSFWCSAPFCCFVVLCPMVTGAQPDGGAEGNAACTTGCHEEGVSHDNKKHAKVTCIDCHPNIPDGQEIMPTPSRIRPPT